MTENATINSYVDELKRDRKRFDDLFFIRLLDSELPSNTITDSVETFLKGAAVRQGPVDAAQGPAPAEDPASAQAPASAVSAEADEKPARIVYRIDEAAVYDDGAIKTELTEEYTALKIKEFYVIGSWVSATELEVSKKIAGAVQKGLGDRKRFNFNEEIVFNIDGRSAIDKNTALSIAQLFTKNLAAYKKIVISLSDAHEKVVVKSRGYPMIKDRIAASGGKPAAS